MKYHIITFGCQMNISDSERVSRLFKQNNCKPAKTLEHADFVVVNACSVRQSAVDRVWGLSQKLKKLKAKTILLGCILKEDKKRFFEKFDFVLDISEIQKLPKLLGFKKSAENYLEIEPNPFSVLIPIMTGCNNFCTYCVVPYTRGREVSRPAKDIIKEAKQAVKKGAKEIWLLGQNVNSYSDIPFHQLLRKINDIPGKFWIRFTSSHPKDFSDELITVIKECEKVTEYLNLPVQSGDEYILKRMNRPYTIKQYKDIVKKTRKAVPNICLSTDVIVGFPGETREHFNNTLKLFKKIKFDMAYISQYSPRPNTPAAKMENQISKQEKEKREKELTEALKKTALEKNKEYVGKKAEVLVHAFRKGYCLGKTRTYKTVRFKKGKIGEFTIIKIIKADPFSLYG